MSTPTAAGMIAFFVAMMLPTVAPIPTCTSGITATQRLTIGSLVTFASCAIAPGSTGTPRVHALIGTAPFVSISSYDLSPMDGGH